MNSRDDFFKSPNCPLRLFVRPAELLEATLLAVETRGPGSVLIVPNAVSSDGGATLTDVWESRDGGRGDVSACLLENGLNLGESGDLGGLNEGDGGARAMRMTGDEAASSGCKNGVLGGSSAVAYVP